MTASMLKYLEPVPFTIENEASLGMTETQGLLACDGRNIVIEFRTADTIVGLVKTQSKEITIPIESVRSIRFAKKFLGVSCAITLQTFRQQPLEALGDSRHGALEMKVRRRDRTVAENFCLEVGQEVLRNRNERIAGELDE